MSEQEPSILNVTCPKCGHKFKLSEKGLHVESCESGGVYGVYVECEKCQHIESLDW